MEVIEVKRKELTTLSTIGELSWGKIKLYTLEDPVRDGKIKGITAIPEGTYKLGIKNVDTPMTKKYKDKYWWFKKHIEILRVPNYGCVYIHIGNKATDSNGCLLVGTSKSKDFIGNSTVAFKKLYDELYYKLIQGDEIYIRITNEFKDTDGKHVA